MDGIEGIFYAKAAAFIAAAIVMSIGSLGPALGQGLIGMKACENIGKYPENANNIRNAMIIALALVETCALYCLLIALALLFFANKL